jgi:hypothetical protein
LCDAIGVVSFIFNLRTRWRLLRSSSRHGNPAREELVPVPIELAVGLHRQSELLGRERIILPSPGIELQLLGCPFRFE